MSEESQRRLSPLARVAVLLLVAWSVFINLSDVARIFVPLASLGFSADNDGRVTEVLSPPALGKLQEGDHIDLSENCRRGLDSKKCADVLAVVGGLAGSEYLASWHAPVDLTAVRDGRQFNVSLAPQIRPLTGTAWLFLIVDEALTLIFIFVATAMVWQLPNSMTWGFFAYALWFNPGQVYFTYALLQMAPAWMLVEEVLQSAALAVGYAGFLWFVLRFPENIPEPRWRTVERAIPLVAIIFFAVQLWAYLNAFGVPTQAVVIALSIMGFFYDACVLRVLYLRMRSQQPLDRQRLRWVFWGAAIGLPPFLVAEFIAVSGSSKLEGVVYILNACSAVLPIAIYHVVRRYRVMDVSFVFTRRITLFLTWVVFGVFFAVVAELTTPRLHALGVSLVATGAVVVMSLLFESLHELINSVADRFLFKSFHGARRAFESESEKFKSAEDFDEISRVITEVPLQRLHLVSAAVFITDSAGGTKTFVRRKEVGWDNRSTRTLDQSDPIIEQALNSRRRLRIRSRPATSLVPTDDGVPVVGIPLLDNGAVAGIALFSGHDNGALINDEELAILARFVGAAADAYGRFARRVLEADVAALRAQLAEIS